MFLDISNKQIANSKNISLWKSKRLSDEIIKPPATSNNILSPSLNHMNTKIRAKWNLFKTRKNHTYSQNIVNI